MRTLDLALIGNGRIGLLVEASGRIVWGCFPRFDGDPMFCALLDDAPDDRARGQFAIELSDHIIVGRKATDPAGLGYYSFRAAGFL